MPAAPSTNRRVPLEHGKVDLDPSSGQILDDAGYDARRVEGPLDGASCGRPLDGEREDVPDRDRTPVDSELGQPENAVAAVAQPSDLDGKIERRGEPFAGGLWGQPGLGGGEVGGSARHRLTERRCA